MANGESDVLCAYQLGIAERKDYTIDVSGELKDRTTGEIVDSISLVTWSADPDDGQLKLENQFEVPVSQPIAVGIWASTPRRAISYRVKAHVTTGQGREFDAVIVCGGIKK